MEQNRNALRLCDHNREVLDERFEEYEVNISDDYITINIYEDLVDYRTLFPALCGFDEWTVTELYGLTQIRIQRDYAGGCNE